MKNDLLNCKVILISQIPLPYSKIGSWTVLYKNYIESKNNLIDYIVCEKPDFFFDKVKYSVVKPNIFTKLVRKYTKRRYVAYINALDSIINKHDKYVIQIVDNFFIVEHIVKYLRKNKIKKNFYIQFFYHSYPPYFEINKGEIFFNSIDEIILLTYLSYKSHINYYRSLPTKVSLLHNGIDGKSFFKLSVLEKYFLRKEFKIEDKKIFIWCSQDRPKKGLKIILEAWKLIMARYDNIELWVIGCEPRENQLGVKYLGIIPNANLPRYLQAADCYLFSSLCQEGFPLSLTEALHCGNYCIASNVGGVSEVMQFGEYGTLIDNPHFINDWVYSIIEYLEGNCKKINFPETLYTLSDWYTNMDSLINQAKKNLE